MDIIPDIIPDLFDMWGQFNACSSEWGTKGTTTAYYRRARQSRRHDERVNKMKHHLFVFSIFIRNIKGIFMTLTLDQDTKHVMRSSSCLSLSSESFLSINKICSRRNVFQHYIYQTLFIWENCPLAPRTTPSVQLSFIFFTLCWLSAAMVCRVCDTGSCMNVADTIKDEGNQTNERWRGAERSGTAEKQKKADAAKHTARTREQCGESCASTKQPWMKENRASWWKRWLFCVLLVFAIDQLMQAGRVASIIFTDLLFVCWAVLKNTHCPCHILFSLFCPFNIFLFRHRSTSPLTLTRQVVD